MHLQICRINAYSAAVARVSTRTHYSLTSSLSPRTDEPPPPLPPRVSTLYTLAARSRSPRIRADVGRRARASRLRNHVSEENLAAGYFLKIRDFKIRVGKQPPSPLLHPIRESRATPLDQIHSPTLGSTSIRYSLFLLGGCCAPICAPSSPFRLF